jgi:membrane-associated phospholipid phosphatase
MQIVSGLGDLRLVLPAVVLTLALLAAYGQYDVCRRLVVGVFCCFAATFVAKVIGLGLARLSVTDLVGSPSGHTALAATFVGSLTLIARRDQRPAASRLLLAGGTLLVLAVAHARIVNGAHTPFDVVEGAAIGLACVVPLARLVRAPSMRPVPAWPLIGLVAVVAVFRAIFPAQDLDTEQLVRLLTRLIFTTFDLRG